MKASRVVLTAAVTAALLTGAVPPFAGAEDSRALVMNGTGTGHAVFENLVEDSILESIQLQTELDPGQFALVLLSGPENRRIVHLVEFGSTQDFFPRSLPKGEYHIYAATPGIRSFNATLTFDSGMAGDLTVESWNSNLALAHSLLPDGVNSVLPVKAERANIQTVERGLLGIVQRYHVFGIGAWTGPSVHFVRHGLADADCRISSPAGLSTVPFGLGADLPSFFDAVAGAWTLGVDHASVGAAIETSHRSFAFAIPYHPKDPNWGLPNFFWQDVWSLLPAGTLGPNEEEQLRSLACLAPSIGE